jgi:hypothetical protein
MSFPTIAFGTKLPYGDIDHELSAAMTSSSFCAGNYRNNISFSATHGDEDLRTICGGFSWRRLVRW